MTPVLLAPRYDAIASSSERSSPTLQAEDETPVLLTPWVMILIITGVVLAVTLAVFAFLYLARKKRQAREFAARADPIASQRELLFKHRRKMSTAERAEADELERTVMIRKSLISRASSHSLRSAQNTDSARSLRLLDDVPVEEAEGVVGDWKEWEARVQRQRTEEDFMRDPVSQGRGHPAFSPELEQLAVPVQSRAPSRAPSPAMILRHKRQSPRIAPLSLQSPNEGTRGSPSPTSLLSARTH